MIKLYSTILCFLFFFFGSAQKETDSDALKEDTNSTLVLRSLDKNLGQKYHGKEFNYNIKDGESQNLLARFLSWAMNGLKDVFGINVPPGITQILEYLIYALMGALAIYLLVRFLTGENASTLFSQKATSFISIPLTEESIENLDLDALIKNAIAHKDYRLAIRYQYLNVLKTLSQQGVITWHYEKTNQDYEKEINIPPIKSLFKDVSYLYEHIWYGEQDIDEQKYQIVEIKFTSLNTVGANG